jgi:hypothetical protein
MKLILDSQYFPSIPYIALVGKADVVAINDTELFNKQSYRNRCSILGSNGKLDLIVSVDHKSSRNMNDLKINYSERWNAIHFKSIKSSYNKSPFFEFYEEEILSPLLAKYERLIDLNTAILTNVLEALEIETKVVFLSQLEAGELVSFENFTEYIHPKRPKIELVYRDYLQVFSTTTIKDLSILDALFCLGNETQLFLDEVKYPI